LDQAIAQFINTHAEEKTSREFMLT